MSVFSKIKKALINPYWFFSVILRRLSFLIKDDCTFVKFEYYLGMHKKLNLDAPQTYNEKLQWLKLNCRQDRYSALVDKYEVKNIVADIIGEQYIIPTLGVWDKFEDIDFDLLPEQFVLKCTHDSGGLVICDDKETFDIKAAKKKIERSQRKNYYYEHREYPYKGVCPRIIAEKFMVDNKCNELRDYKFFCFGGEVKFMFIASDRPHDTRFDFFDRNFEHLPITQGHPMADKLINKPAGFEEMIRLAEKLSKDIPHVRVDFYEVNDSIYFGEMTFFHFSGNVPFEPEEWDYKIGEMLTLP